MKAPDTVLPGGWPDVRYKLQFSSPLSEHDAKTLNSIPGAWGKGFRAEVPYSLVEYIAAKHPVAHWSWAQQPTWPHQPKAPADFENLKAALRQAGVSEHLLAEQPGADKQFNLAPFQLDAIWRVWHLGSAGLREEMGAGKTVQGLCWSALVSPNRPVLVLTKTAVVLPMCKAIERFLQAPALELPAPSQCPVVKGRRLTPVELMAEHFLRGNRYVVCGWGGLDALYSSLAQFKFNAVIFDESQMAKAVKRWSWTSTAPGELEGELLESTTALAYALACQIPFRLIMTGTPVHDRLKDWWGQLSLIEPRGWGITAKKFMFRYCNAQAGEYGGLEAKGKINEDELEARLSAVIVSVPREVSHAQLPPLRVEVRYLSAEQQDPVPAELKKESRRLAKEAAGGSPEARQALREAQLVEACAMKRSAVLAELVDQYESTPDGKVVVFTGRHADAWAWSGLVAKKLDKVKLYCGVEQTDDGFALPSNADREALRAAYMDTPGPSLFLGTGYAYGTGIDLHDSDLLVIAMLPWSPGDLQQWLMRVWRLGLKKPVRVLIFVAQGSADDAMILALLDKVPVAVEMGGQTTLRELSPKLTGRDDRSDEEVFADLAADFADAVEEEE